MLSTKEILEQLESLPVEERALVADSLIKSLNRAEPDLDREWAEEAARRLAELRSRRVSSVPSEQVYARAMERLAE